MDTKTKTVVSILTLALAAIPTIAIAQDDGPPSTADADQHLDTLAPADQFKVDYSEAENELIGQWYEENGIAYSWHQDEGTSRYVVPDIWNAEAQAVTAAYNQNLVVEDHPQDAIDTVNAEVDDIIEALADAGILATGDLDAEGFKTLMVNISPDDGNAEALWEQANAIIEGLGS